MIASLLSVIRRVAMARDEALIVDDDGAEGP